MLCQRLFRQKFFAASSLIMGAAFALSLAASGPKAEGKGDVAKGKEAFEQCAICHNVDTDEKKMGPSLKGLFKRKTLSSGKPVNDANVLAQINAGGTACLLIQTCCRLTTKRIFWRICTLCKNPRWQIRGYGLYTGPCPHLFLVFAYRCVPWLA